jgi:PAS domain S-box-containing protein
VKLAYTAGHPDGTRFPGRWLATAAALTLTMFAWLGWHVYNSYRVAAMAKDAHTAADAFGDRIEHLEQSLAMSSRMAAATGEAVWLARYRDLEKRSHAATAEGERFTWPRSYAPELERIAAAHRALAQSRGRALSLLSKGERSQALDLLSSPDYERERTAFLDAADGLVSAMGEDLTKVLAAERNKELFSVLVALLIFLVSLLVWIKLVARMRAWRLTLLREVTARMAAERETLASTEKFRRLFEHGNDSIFLVDPQTRRFVEVNVNAAWRLGYSREELLRLTLDDIDAESSPGGGDAFERLVAEAPMSFERVHRRKDGTLMPVEISGQPVVDSGGREVYQCVVRDISERKHLEAELRQAQKLEAMGQLAGGVAHDFSNLLTAITGQTALAKQTLTRDHPALRFIENVELAAEQATGVVRALLTFSRRAPARKEPVDLAEVVRQTARLLRGTLPAAVTLEEKVPSQVQVWVQGNSNQIQQAVLNLVINARDAMPTGGTVSLSCGLARGEGSVSVATLKVADTGVGMTQEVQERLFEPFFTTKPAGQGTGLGLPIVHGIVTDHGGCIAVHSEVGKGTAVTLTFPALPPPSVGELLRGDHAGQVARGELILLAEHQAYARSIIADALEAAGYRVEAQADAAGLLEAVRRHRDRRPLLVIDAELPGCDGLDCVGSPCTDGSPAPILLIAGTLDPRLDNLLGGEAMVLHKPFQVSELVRLAQRLIGRSGTGV